jgi:hypothetical protein
MVKKYLTTDYWSRGYWQNIFDHKQKGILSWNHRKIFRLEIAVFCSYPIGACCCASTYSGVLGELEAPKTTDKGICL